MERDRGFVSRIGWGEIRDCFREEVGECSDGGCTPGEARRGMVSRCWSGVETLRGWRGSSIVMMLGRLGEGFKGEGTDRDCLPCDGDSGEALFSSLIDSRDVRVG